MEQIGFTDGDRKTLITLEIHIDRLLKDMKDFELRMSSIENTRITERDLKALWTEIDEMRATATALVKRIDTFDRWRWVVIGASGVIVATFEIVFKLVKG